MKRSLTIFIFFTILSPIYANTLECPREEGIKACQKEAESFCDGASFNIKRASTKYSITCESSSKAVQSNSDKIIEDEDNAGDNSKVVKKEMGRWRFALGIGFNGAGTADSDIRALNTSTGVTSTGTVEFDVDSGFNLNFEARHLMKNGWGFTTGLDLDFAREVKSGTVTVGSSTVTVSGSSDPDEWSAVVIYGNLVYKWENFYIPFGLNISSIDYSSTGLNVNTISSIGAQLGIGFETDTNFAFELYSRALGYELDYIDGNLNVLFEDGIMSDMAIRAKYIF